MGNKMQKKTVINECNLTPPFGFPLFYLREGIKG
jgi:hypothetical protein